MGIVKVHRYGVRTDRLGEHTLVLQAPAKQDLEVAMPPDFKDGVRGVWSPEELLLGALASCYELTTVAIAERREVPIRAIRTDCTGQVQTTKDGHFRFVLVELDLVIETDVGHEHHAEAAARLAKDRCIVAGALDVPVRLTVSAHAVDHTLAVA